MKRVAAIVVTFNKKEYLKNCLKALQTQTVPFTVFVIDNNSTDGTKEAIAPFLEDTSIRYYNTGDNLGGAGGFHFGLKKAYAEGYDAFWLMDDDVEASPDSLEAILNAEESLEKKEQPFGFLCSNVRFTDGAACKMNIPDVAEDWLDFSELLKDGLQPVSRATFVGFYVPRSTVKEVGLPIKEFFIWADDSNYSWRISKQFPCFLVQDSILTHHMKQNETAALVEDTSDRLDRYFYAYRNRYYNARMLGELDKYYLRILTTTINILRKSTRKKEKLHIMYKGVLAGITFRPPVEYVQD